MSNTSTWDALLEDICLWPDNGVIEHVAADWLEDSNDLAGAECLRWLADNYKRSLYWHDNSDNMPYMWYDLNCQLKFFDTSDEGDLPDQRSNLPSWLFARLTRGKLEIGQWLNRSYTTRREGIEDVLAAWRACRACGIPIIERVAS